jgi:hypothetical protein
MLKELFFSLSVFICCYCITNDSINQYTSFSSWFLWVWAQSPSTASLGPLLCILYKAALQCWWALQSYMVPMLFPYWSLTEFKSQESKTKALLTRSCSPAPRYVGFSTPQWSGFLRYLCCFFSDLYNYLHRAQLTNLDSPTDNIKSTPEGA